MIRTFTRTFAISPHRYLVARRVELARDLLLDGWPASAVAAEVGFHDRPTSPGTSAATWA